MSNYRRENYESGYHWAHTTKKKAFVMPTIKGLVEENPPPENESGLGRPKVYPAQIMGTICILIQVEGPTFPGRGKRGVGVGTVIGGQDS